MPYIRKAPFGWSSVEYAHYDTLAKRHLSAISPMQVIFVTPHPAA